MKRRTACLLLSLALLLPGTCFADSLEKVLPSVVSVLPEWPPDVRRVEEPEGSGVVILDGRAILTAAHIVNKSLSVRIRTSEGVIVPAEIRGRDLGTDLALLHIERPLQAIGIESEEPELGDRVCAVSNAFGLGLSVTCGVVSGLHRAGVGFNHVEDFVQTDAAVNPGSSGGALVTSQGKLVGLLSAIFTKRSDANTGVNFAVSATLAMQVAEALEKDGRVRRTPSGLRLKQAPGKGETGRLGARVVFVREGSLAEKAGVIKDDIIIRAGQRRVRKPADFVSVMSGFDVAGSLEVELKRGVETLTLRFTR